MKKFNFDKILLCFGIFFVSIFGVGLIDSHALSTTSEDSYNSFKPKYYLTFDFDNYYSQASFSRIIRNYKLGSNTEFFIDDEGFFRDKDGNLMNLTVYFKTQNIQNAATSDPYYDKPGFSTDTYNNISSIKLPTSYIYYNDYQHYQDCLNNSSSALDTPNYLNSSINGNFKCMYTNGKVFFQDNPIKEVKKVGQAVKNQTKVILPIAIFLMACLLLVQILRRVLVRYSIG